jgi:hypothetical protein
MRKRFYARTTPWGTIQTGDWFAYLTADEQSAVIMHEAGHIRKRHHARRLWWVLSLKALLRPEQYFAMCEQQEYEADRYAKAQGWGDELISFLITHGARVKSPGYPSNQERIEALNG